MARNFWIIKIHAPMCVNIHNMIYTQYIEGVPHLYADLTQKEEL